jgi:hypothetical protein
MEHAVGTGKQYKHCPLVDRKSQLLDAASHCRRLAGGLRNLEAIGMIALAYEFEDRHPSKSTVIPEPRWQKRRPPRRFASTSFQSWLNLCGIAAELMHGDLTSKPIYRDIINASHTMTGQSFASQTTHVSQRSRICLIPEERKN